MAKRYGTQFRHRPSAQVFGPVSGSSDEWTYQKILQYKTERVYVATFELGNTPGNFVLPASEIIPQSLEAIDGICVIVQAVRGESPGPVKPPMGKTTTTKKQPTITRSMRKPTITTKKSETIPQTDTTEEPECDR